MADLLRVALFLILFFLLDLAGHCRGVIQVGQWNSWPAANGMIVANMKGMDGDEVTLALQTHDLSFAGFTNRRLDWLAFLGKEHLVPTSRPLPFGNSYRDLIGNLKNLPELPLGRASGLQAIQVLYSYDPDTTDAGDGEALKRAVTALTVMISDSVRPKPIRETISNGWESEACVLPEHLPYIEH